MTAPCFVVTWPMRQCKNEASRISGNWMGGRAPRTEMNRDALLRRIFSPEGNAYTGTRQSQEGKGRVRQYTLPNATSAKATKTTPLYNYTKRHSLSIRPPIYIASVIAHPDLSFVHSHGILVRHSNLLRHTQPTTASPHQRDHTLQNISLVLHLP